MSKSVAQQLKKKFGDSIFVSGQSIIDTPRIIIPLSPALDLILGGGIQEGSLVILTGVQKAGKTSCALNFAGTAQQSQYDSKYGPRHVYFLNIEGRIEKRDLKGIQHLDLNSDRFTIIQSNINKILSGEEYIEIGESLIKSHPGSIFIFDSFSQLCTAGEMEANIGDRYRADSPLLLARFCRRISNVIKVNNCIILGVTHQIANQGIGMSQYMEASGRKLQYQTDVKLRVTHKKIINTGDKPTGQEVYWECQTSNLGPPGLKGTSYLRYGYGLDKEYELVNLCSSIGVINKGGAWYTFPNGEKTQGIEKTSQYLRNNPEVYDELNTVFRKFMELPDVS